MDAFFESPKHGSNSNSGAGQQNKLDDSLSEALADNTHPDMQTSQPMDTNIQFSTNTVGDVSTTDDLVQHHHEQQAMGQLANNLILSEQAADLNNLHTNTQVINDIIQPQQQVAEMSSHVKLEMENGQVVVVDSSQIENVTLVQQGLHTFTDQQQLQSTNQFNHQQQQLTIEHHQLVVNSNGSVATLVDSSSLIGLDSNEQMGASDPMDEDGLDDEHNDDVNLKEIDKFDDSLAMSPCGFGSLSGVASSPYTMNGSNVSTHTFRKTEWDVKKLENYVRISFGDVTPMENMEPSLMNRYLISFFRVIFKGRILCLLIIMKCWLNGKSVCELETNKN